MSESLKGISWIILGSQTPYNPATAPKKIWIDEIIESCDEAGVAVFLKENLRPVLKAVYGDGPIVRQEMPDDR